ncbi:major facilitator superfamily transporter [Fusarium subglutinans]|uniref:Major facilitator superfamily transporter n=1 Tax=Gibberella subglutinans TaxID=42677 RepID=A0A8H5US92_GIBSU|nr:major facilitator superfamily transporter [Fusarium subglutinans]KAF5597496.1 major facilitator superfamily transporter [Fusarium subglutinans]
MDTNNSGDKKKLSVEMEQVNQDDKLADDIPPGEVLDAENEFSDTYYRKLLWKIDLWLLPLMWRPSGVWYPRRHRSCRRQFNWLSTIFYLSYLVCEAPGNWLMQKSHTGKFLSIVMVLWGVIVLCIAFAKNFAHLMVLRAIQGVFECTISPTFMLITGAFYTSQEHTLRSLIWGTSNAGMNIIAGLSMYGIGLHAEKHPGDLAAWKGISFLLGALTITCGILVWFILGTPREVRCLSEEEKRAAIARDQVWAAFKDPQTYFFFFITIINALPNGANTTFSKLIWKSFGFTPLETLLKGSTPYYCVSIYWFLVVGYVTLKKPNIRFLMMMFSLIPAFSGMMALAFLPQDSMKWTRWGMYILQVFGSLPGLMIWTFLPSNVAGRTKKTVTATTIFVAYCVGNAVGAQMFVASDAPRYIRGLTACAILYCVEFLSMASWRFYYIWENRRRAKMIREQGISEEESERLGRLNAEADMTDRENIHFKYKD